MISDDIIRTPPYKHSIKEDEFIDKETAELEKAGLIRPSNSPHNSPIVLALKQDGTYRMTNDFRKVNNNSVPDHLPVPLIRSIFDRISGCVWMSLIDLKAGYHSCALDPKSSPYTAFTTKRRKYEWTVLPYGLKNAVGHFCVLIDMVLGDLECCVSYLDDILCFSPDFDTHCKDLEEVFKRLRKANLRANPNKCKFFTKKLRLLGHILTGSTIECDPAKVEAWTNRPPPRNVKETKEVLGGFGYYRSSMRDYAKFARPLIEITKKEKGFVWGNDEKESFRLLKKKLKEYPVLRLPVLDRPFLLFCDASNYCLGAVLSQIDPDDNREYVIEYASRVLKNAERFYSAAEREALCIIYAINLWRHYLCNHFTVFTDAKALSYLMNVKSPNARLCRWFIFLQAFDFTIKYKKGVENKNADCLSRPPIYDEVVLKNANDALGDTPVNPVYFGSVYEDDSFAQMDPVDGKRLEENVNLVLRSKNIQEEVIIPVDNEYEQNSRNIDPYDDEGLMYYLKYGKHLNGLPRKQINRITSSAKLFRLENGILLYKKNNSKNEFLIYPDKDKRLDLAQAYHSLGHFGSEATYKRLLEKYFWRNMIKDVQHVVERCLTCQRHSREIVKHHPAIAISAENTFDAVVCDTSWGYPLSDDGHHGVLTIVDRFSKFPFAYALKSKNAEEITEKLLDCFCLMSFPKTIQSDRGTELVNKVVQKLLDSSGIDRRISSSYSARSQGICEKFNDTLAIALRKVAESNTKNWDKYIPYVLFCYRTKINESSKFTPFQLVFGREPNHFENWNLKPDDNEVNQLYVRSMELKKHFDETIPTARENLEKSKEKQIKIQNKRDNIVEERITPGTPVYVKSQGLLTKMASRYQGPFRVVKDASGGNYILENALGEVLTETFPRQKLKIVADTQKEDETTFEIEKIIDSKIENGDDMYLVKFKNSTEPDAWLKVAAFDSLDCINEYNRTKNIESNLLESKTTEKAITEVNKNNLRIERKPKKKSNEKRKVRRMMKNQLE